MITPKFDLDIINGELYQKIHSNMKSLDNKDFAGIGLRLHQLRVERMLQNNLGNVCIVERIRGVNSPQFYLKICFLNSL